MKNTNEVNEEHNAFGLKRKPLSLFCPASSRFRFFLYLHKTHPSGSPTKKDAENDPLRTRTQSMQKTSRGQMPVPSPVSLPFNPRDSTKGPYSY